MAIVRKLEKLELERESTHTEVKATFSVISDDEGQRYLQIDTYGSKGRKFEGK